MKTIIGLIINFGNVDIKMCQIFDTRRSTWFKNFFPMIVDETFSLNVWSELFLSQNPPDEPSESNVQGAAVALSEIIPRVFRWTQLKPKGKVQ